MRRGAGSGTGTAQPVVSTIEAPRFGWNGVVAPRGVPQAVINTLNQRMKDQLATPEIRQAYLAQGEEPAYSTVEEFRKLIADDYVQMGRMVKLAGIKPE